MASAKALIGLAALLAAGPVRSTPAAVDPDTAASLRALAAKDLRVASVAYRLQVAALPYCRQRQRLSGLIVQDASQYRADLRPAVAEVFGLADLPAITGVVPGSPADRAGLRVGDAITAIDGQPLLAAAGTAPKRADGARFTMLIATLAKAFAAGPVTLAIRRDGQAGTVRMTGAEACLSDVQLDLASVKNAASDGQMVSISQGLLDFLHSDDELAFVIGHELSHNILDHRDFLDTTRTRSGRMFSGVGRNGTRLRATERQADYLGLYLVAWAGYDPNAAAPFWRRLGKADPLGTLMPDGSHPGTGHRATALEAEADAIDAQRRAGRRPAPDPAQLAPIP